MSHIIIMAHSKEVVGTNKTVKMSSMVAMLEI